VERRETRGRTVADVWSRPDVVGIASGSSQRDGVSNAEHERDATIR
jgi:hypothetical protein